MFFTCLFPLKSLYLRHQPCVDAHNNFQLMKYPFVISLLCMLIFTASCQEENPDLASAYSYLDRNQLDSARVCLDRVDMKSLNEAGQALYCLVKTRWDYLSYVPITKDDLIQRSVAYYEEEGNDSLLAESLFYQAMILYGNGEAKRAFRLLKRADVVASECGSGKLKHKIVEALTGYNMEEGEFDLALRYAKRTLSLSRQLQDPSRIGYAYAYLSEIYDFLDKRDSARYYLDRCVDYIGHIPVRERSGFYNQVAMMYMDIDKKQAKEFALRSYRLKPSWASCCLLAQLDQERGDAVRADSLLSKALSLAEYTRDSLSVLGEMVNVFSSRYDYEKAFSSLEQLYKTRKRLENTIKENDARVVQLGFDAEMEQWRQGKIFAYIIMVVLSLAIFFLCLWLKSCIRFSKEHRKVMEGELLIRDYREKLAKLPKDDQEKRSRYEEKLAMVTKEQAQRLSNGVKLYEEIKTGGTISQWSKSDMTQFIEYYKLVDLEFVRHLENDYSGLSRRYMIFAILCHMEMGESEVERAMAISHNTYRSIKSRVKGKRKQA